jgi:hypothetical protein
MSLEKWVEYGWLRREPTSPSEIKDLLGIMERSLISQRGIEESVDSSSEFHVIRHSVLPLMPAIERPCGRALLLTIAEEPLC